MFANEIEEDINSCAVQVGKRRSAKRYRTEKLVGGLEGNRVRSADARVISVRYTDSKRVETCSGWMNISADYVVDTLRSRGESRLKKRCARSPLCMVCRAIHSIGHRVRRFASMVSEVDLFKFGVEFHLRRANS